MTRGRALFDRLRPAAAEPIECAKCGASFRAAYTGGRCPICDWTVGVETAESTRLGRLIVRWWAPGLVALVIAGNIAIFVVVALKMSSSSSP